MNYKWEKWNDNISFAIRTDVSHAGKTSFRYLIRAGSNVYIYMVSDWAYESRSTCRRGCRSALAFFK